MLDALLMDASRTFSNVPGEVCEVRREFYREVEIADFVFRS